MERILCLSLIASTILCVSCRPSATSPVAITNFTVPVPEGTSNHGDPRIICTPTRWYEIIVFFITNYLAHAFTVKTHPGERHQIRWVTAFLALLFPFSGVPRGLESILRPANYFPRPSDELEKAARSGALCVVVRSESWKPKPGTKVQGVKICKPKAPEARDRDDKLDMNAADEVYRQPYTSKPENPRKELVQTTVQTRMVHNKCSKATHLDSGPDGKVHRLIQWLYSLTWNKTIQFEQKLFLEQSLFCSNMGNRIEKYRKIHGLVYFPADSGYELMILPKGARVGWNLPDQAALDLGGDRYFASSYNALQLVVAIIQLLSAILTLYRTRGDQLRRYGYAAFGLTVIQYLIMTLVNALGRLMTPEYPALHLVYSPEMRDAIAEGAFFDGVIGRIEEDSASTEPPKVAIEFSQCPADDRDANLEAVVITAGGGQHSNMGIRPGDRFFVDQPCKTTEVGHVREEIPQCTKHKLELQVPNCTAFKKRLPWMSSIVYRLVKLLILLLLSVLPFVAIGAATRFQRGQSTVAERVLTLLWLTSGFIIGNLAAWSKPVDSESIKMVFNIWKGLEVWAKVIILYPRWLVLLSVLVFLPSVAGGFVVVGIMLKQYGFCNLV